MHLMWVNEEKLYFCQIPLHTYDDPRGKNLGHVMHAMEKTRQRADICCRQLVTQEMPMGPQKLQH